jgi:hypothetical protein
MNTTTIRCIKVVHHDGTPTIFHRNAHSESQMLEIAEPGHDLDGLRGDTTLLAYALKFHLQMATGKIQNLGPIDESEISIYETGERIRMQQKGTAA